MIPCPPPIKQDKTKQKTRMKMSLERFKLTGRWQRTSESHTQLEFDSGLLNFRPEEFPDTCFLLSQRSPRGWCFGLEGQCASDEKHIQDVIRGHDGSAVGLRAQGFTKAMFWGNLCSTIETLSISVELAEILLLQKGLKWQLCLTAAKSQEVSSSRHLLYTAPRFLTHWGWPRCQLSRQRPYSLTDWTQTQGQVRDGDTHLFSHHSTIGDERNTCREWCRECTLVTLVSFPWETVPQLLGHKALEEA